MEKNDLDSFDIQGSASDSSGPSTSSPPLFIVESFFPVFISSWKTETGICSICRNLVEGPCVNCQTTADITRECHLCWGKCGHVFHKHCIDRWIVAREVCPLDNQPWEQNKLWDEAYHKLRVDGESIPKTAGDEESPLNVTGN